MSEGIFIRNEPERIATVAAEMEQHHKQFRDKVAAIFERSGSLSKDWEGSSSELYSKNAQELNSRAQDMSQVMQELIRDLNEVAGIYRDAETSAKSQAQALPTEGVFRK